MNNLVLIFSVILIWISGAMMGISFGMKYERSVIEQSAVDSGIAQYDSNTREFKWNTQNEQ